MIIVGGEAFLRPLQPLFFLFMDLENISLMSDGFSHTYDASDDPMQRRFLHLNRLVLSVHVNQAPAYISMIQNSMR